MPDDVAVETLTLEAVDGGTLVRVRHAQLDLGARPARRERHGGRHDRDLRTPRRLVTRLQGA